MAFLPSGPDPSEPYLRQMARIEAVGKGEVEPVDREEEFYKNFFGRKPKLLEDLTDNSKAIASYRDRRGPISKEDIDKFTKTNTSIFDEMAERISFDFAGNQEERDNFAAELADR